MQFTDTLNTTKKFPAKNQKKGLIVHHTGKGTYKGLTRYLSGNPVAGGKNPSVHYTVGQDGEVAKIGSHDDALWHVGDGKYKSGVVRNLNKYFLGIEIVSDGYVFSPLQKQRTGELIRFIIKAEGFKPEQILRHADVAGYRGKWDVGENFYKGMTWKEYVQSLFVDAPKETNKQEILVSSQRMWKIANGYIEYKNERMKDYALTLIHEVAEMERAGGNNSQQLLNLQDIWRIGAEDENIPELAEEAARCGELVRVF